MPARSKPEVRVIVRYMPDLQRQVQALLRLLDHVKPEPEIPQPQNPVESGAANFAVDANDSHIRGLYHENIISQDIRQ